MVERSSIHSTQSQSRLQSLTGLTLTYLVQRPSVRFSLSLCATIICLLAEPTPVEGPSNGSTSIAPTAPFEQLMEVWTPFFSHTPADLSFQTPERSVPLSTNDKLHSLLDSCRRTTPSLSIHGMRTIKSLSGRVRLFILLSSLSVRLESISLQKKIAAGTDRLKRLVITRSLLKRRTAAFRKQMSDLKNKLLNPFGKMKISLEPRKMPDRPVIVRTPPSRMVISRSIKPRGGSAEQIGQERGKLQVLSLNSDLGRSIDVASHQDPAEVAKKNGRIPFATSMFITAVGSLSSAMHSFSGDETLQAGCSHHLRHTFTC